MNENNSELAMLKRRVKQLQMMCSASLLVVMVVAVCGFASSHTGNADKQDAVLRLRGLVIEDEQGRPRILLGSPTPRVTGRRRPEAVDGIVLVGPNGADRFVVSYPGYEPQVMGKVAKRTYDAPSAGFMINDAEGNERVGLGTSDDGNRTVLGMDYADRDAMGLLVSPNFSGLAMFARSGPHNDQITMGITKNGTATAKLADIEGEEGMIADVRKDSPAKLQMRNPKTSKLEDVSDRLFP